MSDVEALDWRDNPLAHHWELCCCRERGDGHCWQCGQPPQAHRAWTRCDTAEEALAMAHRDAEPKAER